MAKYLLHPKHPLRTIIYIILALGLVVGGIATFKASQISTEGRSKAAQEGRIYARWEFNGVTSEGWVVEGFQQALSVIKGKLQVLMVNNPYSSTSIFKQAINAPMKTGNKMLKFRMAVGRKSPTIPPNSGPTPTSIVVDAVGSSDAGVVDCNVASNGVSTCSTTSSDSSTQPGSDVGGFGNVNPPATTTIILGDPASINNYPCVARPTCAAGVECLTTLQEPIGGWCPVGRPITTSCTPCTDPRGFCPLEEYSEPIGGWCLPVPTPKCTQMPPPCEGIRCPKFPTVIPPGGWCPSGEFTFDVMYAYEDVLPGGGQDAGPGGPRRIEKTLQVKGQANGKFYTYNIVIPEIQDIKIQDLRISFTNGVNLGTSVVFDWIRLTEPKLKAKFKEIQAKPKLRARVGGTLSLCGIRCKRDSDCAESFTCIQPVTPQCEGLGCVIRSAKKVCALAPAQNAKGYTCEAGGN